MPKRITTLYDRGTAKDHEDFFFVGENLAVVADGVSAPYNNERPIEMIDGKTGGGKVASMICDRFRDGGADIPLRSRVLQINALIGEWQVERGLSRDRADFLPGAAMVAVKFTPEELTIAYTADAIALWRYANKRLAATENQLWLHEPEMREAFAAIMKEVGGDRAAAWEKYFPSFCAGRLRDVNGEGEKAFGLLNGQEGFAQHLESFSISAHNTVQTLIVCSDGLLPLPLQTPSAKIPLHIVQKTFELYDIGGLDAILAWKRQYDKAQAGISHIAEGEATGIAIEF